MSRERDSRAAAFRADHPGTRVELPYAGFDTFLKSEPADVEEAGGHDAAVLGAPYDGAVSNRPGARYGPGAVREASNWFAYLSGYKGGLSNVRTGQRVDFGALDLVDCGDVPVFPMDRAATADSIAAHVATVADRGTMPVLIGGDHYCTVPAVRGFAEGAGHDTVGLVQIDAHSDTVAESPLYGEHFHGSSTHEIGTAPHSGFEHVSQVGIRGYEGPEYFEFVEESGLSLFTIRDVEQRGIRPVMEDAVAAAAEDTDAVYVTFDIDSVDPSVAPATGTPVPGGLSAAQALSVMEVLGAHDAVGAVDLMEVAPPYDQSDDTSRLAAALLVTLLERQFAE